VDKFLLSSDELSECIQGYRVLSDSMINDLKIIKRIKQQLDKNNRTYEHICMIENDINKQINSIDTLVASLDESLKKYTDTELLIFSHIQKRLFMNFGPDSLNDVIVERECEFSESMLLENHTLRHEEWLLGLVSENKNHKGG